MRNEGRNEWFGVGIYSVGEAARLTGVSTSRIGRWVRGYTFRSSGAPHSSPPVWGRQLPELEGRLALGFRDPIEVRFVDAFLRHGVTWKTIRRAGQRAMNLFKTDHPFNTKRFKTDGQRIFAEVVEEAGESSLIELVKSQYAFGKILEPYLYVGLEFHEDDAIRWWPLGRNRRVVIDPERCFGQPIVANEGVPTVVLANAYVAEESVPAVARWYDVDRKSVRDAVEFEKQLAA